MPVSVVPVIGGPIALGTAGSVLFVGAGGLFAEDNSNLFWDAGNAALGLGTASPTSGVRLHVAGTITSPDSGANSERFGAGSSATNDGAAVFGNSATVTGNNATSIGQAATAHTNSVSVGQDAQGDGGEQSNCVTIGQNADCHEPESVSIGRAADANGRRCVVIGDVAECDGDDAVAIGDGTDAHDGAICIGSGADSTAANQLVLGGSGAGITDGYFGNGVVSTTPAAFTLQPTGESGTDQAGVDFNLAGGKSTGDQAGGAVNIQVSPAGTSGTTLNTLVTVISVGAGAAAGTFGIFGATPAAKQTVSGSRGGNAALASLITAMATFGWVTDSSSA